MPREVLDLLQALYGRVATHEALAAQEFRKAYDVEQLGRYGEAEALRAFARSHRIRLLEVRARIGLIKMVFDPERY
jgi:hypothetical protein